jgi:crossover junction endodeoxyribonuclease RusA
MERFEREFRDEMYSAEGKAIMEQQSMIGKETEGVGSEAMISFFVYGLPAPQGSKKHVGRGIMVEQSKHVKPWRSAVAAAYHDWWEANGKPEPLEGPVVLEVVFYMPKPKSARKCDVVPAKRPDLSKLLRSTEDALTGAAYGDDGQITDAHVSKSYAAPHVGASIRIYKREA